MSSALPAGDVRRQFGAVAAAYASSSYHSAGPDLPELVKAAGLTGRERVLDLGCGAGHTALAVAPHAAEVVAVDLTPEMLGVAEALAQQRGASNISFRLADVAALPFEDASFDAVTSRVSAHHYAEPAKAMAEAARVLRPGGALLLVDTMAPEDPALDTFYNGVEILRDPSHVRNWSVSGWQRMLTAAGFASAEVRYSFMLDLPGDNWTERMQTPADNVTGIKAMFASATPAAREFFRLKLGSDWGWTIPIALIEARKAP